MWPRDFLSTFLAPIGPSLKFPSTFLAARRPSVNYSCMCGIFCQLSIRPRDLQSTFHASAVSSVNFHVSVGPSVNITCGRGTFRKLLSTFHADAGPSVNFHHFFRASASFRQPSVHPRDLLSTSVNSTNVRGNYYQFSVRPLDFPLTLCASVGSSFNVGQLSVRPRVFLSNCIYFP